MSSDLPALPAASAITFAEVPKQHEQEPPSASASVAVPVLPTTTVRDAVETTAAEADLAATGSSGPGLVQQTQQPVEQQQLPVASSEQQQFTEESSLIQNNLKTEERRESEGFIAFNKGFDECEVSPGPTNPVKKDTTTKNGRINHSPTTPLRSIAGASIQILKIDDLRMFCSRNGIKGSRKAKKAEICWAICKAKELWLSGNNGPYKELIPDHHAVGMSGEDGVDHQSGVIGLSVLTGPGGVAVPAGGGTHAHAIKAEAWGEQGIEEDDNDDDLRVKKKRRFASAMASFDNNTHAMAVGLGVAKQSSRGDLMTQHQFIQSKQETNRAIQLHEMIESVATLRRSIREEKDRRVVLLKRLADIVGNGGTSDEDVEELALQKVEEYKASGDLVKDTNKTSYNALLEDIIEQEVVLEQFMTQFDVLSKVVARLMPKDGEENDDVDTGNKNGEEAKKEEEVSTAAAEENNVTQMSV